MTDENENKEEATSPGAISQVYLCTVLDSDGRERVLSTMTSRGVMPMMSVDESERVKLEEAAQEVANQSGAKVRVIHFNSPLVVRVIERQLVQLAGAKSPKIGSGKIGDKVDGRN